jgi:hypothetical protein
MEVFELGVGGEGFGSSVVIWLEGVRRRQPRGWGSSPSEELLVGLRYYWSDQLGRRLLFMRLTE